MKKDFAKVYSYTKMCGYRLFDNILECEYSCLKAHRNGRTYNTKMDYNSLPEYFCDVHRYGIVHNVIDSRGVLKLNYKWFKMNHFMRDSVLEISFNDNENIILFASLSCLKNIFLNFSHLHNRMYKHHHNDLHNFYI